MGQLRGGATVARRRRLPRVAVLMLWLWLGRVCNECYYLLRVGPVGIWGVVLITVPQFSFMTAWHMYSPRRCSATGGFVVVASGIIYEGSFLGGGGILGFLGGLGEENYQLSVYLGNR